MTDYHCHLLPGIDDGPSSVNKSIEMARLLSDAGYHTVYCTPHLIKGLYEADNNTVRKSVNDLQKKLEQQNIALKLLCGREYFLDNNFKNYINDLMPLDNTSYLLIEIPPNAYPGMVQDSFSAIMRQNLIPLLAHPERCKLFHERQFTEQPRKKISRLKKFLHLSHFTDQSELIPNEKENDKDNKLLSWLIENRCAFQSNLPSFKGAYGEQVQATANRLKNLGVYTHSGTDAHTPESLKKLFENDK